MTIPRKLYIDIYTVIQNGLTIQTWKELKKFNHEGLLSKLYT